MIKFICTYFEYIAVGSILLYLLITTLKRRRRWSKLMAIYLDENNRTGKLDCTPYNPTSSNSWDNYCKKSPRRNDFANSITDHIEKEWADNNIDFNNIA